MDQLATSSRSNVDRGCTRDYTSEFTTTETFKSKEDLTNWAKKIGRSNDFTIVVLRSDNKKPRLTLGCERSGKYDSRSGSKKTKMSGTKKCGCPFRLMGRKTGDEWQLEVVKGTHDHDAGHPGKGHSFQGRLLPEEKSLLKEICKTEKQPKEILKALKDSDEHNLSTDRTIYNEFQSMKRRQRLENENFQLQQFMSKAEEYNFIENHRTIPKMDTVLEFFVTHPTSLDMLLAFPTVLKILIYHWVNPERMTLDISGVTSTDVNFYVGMAILDSKRKSSYEWALTSLRGVMNDYGIAMPDIVFLDVWASAKNQIQMVEAPVKVIKDVFSTAKLLLDPTKIIFYIGGRLYELNGVEHQNSFENKWRTLRKSRSKDDFEQRVMQLRTEYPEAVEFVIANVLKPYKEMFVPAWTDQVMHFGNTSLTFDREISYFDFPGNLDGVFKISKTALVVEQTVIDESWEHLQGIIERHHANIKASFEKSLKNEYKDKDGHPELKELHGAISNHALELLRNEIMTGDEYCSCAIRSTHDLPCAHEIAEYKRQGRPVPLECIHSYWKKLDFEPLRKTGEPNVEQSKKRRRRLSEQNSLSLPNIEDSEHNSPNAGPSIVPSTQERLLEYNEVYDIPPSKQFDFVDVCPLQLRPYVREVKHVPRDGHCGFRAIASLVGYPEDDGWRKVRKDLTNELIIDSDHYDQLFGSERVNVLRDALAYYEDICLQKKHWMTMPDMGHIIASCYNVVLVHVSSDQCFTFFPFRTEPTPSSISSTKVIVIGYDREHFYQVYLKEGHPMPPPIPPPTKKRSHIEADPERIYEERSRGWVNLYTSRIEQFNYLQPEVVSQENQVLLYIRSLLLNESLEMK